MCINELVQQIYNNSKNFFQGTKHKNNWYFYHDALLLMTAGNCKNYMRGKEIFKHWILPQRRISSRMAYKVRPMGNSPEMMPMDSNLNKDLHEGAKSHCVYTANLPESDPQKFFLSTPALNTYWGLWDPELGLDGRVPRSKHIKENINQLIGKVLLHIYAAHGALVKGLGTCRGRRRDFDLAPLPRGGKREKKLKWRKSGGTQRPRAL